MYDLRNKRSKRKQKRYLKRKEARKAMNAVVDGLQEQLYVAKHTLQRKWLKGESTLEIIEKSEEIAAKVWEAAKKRTAEEIATLAAAKKAAAAEIIEETEKIAARVREAAKNMTAEEIAAAKKVAAAALRRRSSKEPS
jgi:hypothetical protein